MTAGRARLPVTMHRGGAAHRVTHLAVVLALAGLALALSTANAFHVGQFDTVLIFAIAVYGLNLVSGYGGMLSIGHSALFGVGAYTTGVLVVHAHIQPVATLPLVLVSGFVCGLLMGLPAVRVRGLYLTLVTLAFAVSFPEIVARFASLTGGQLGLVISTEDLRPPGWSPFSRSQSEQWIFWLALILLVLTGLAMRNLVRSRLGLAIQALRDNELGAVGCGVDPHRTRVFVFGCSGAVTGLAGGLYAMYLGTLSIDNSFGLALAIQLITGLIVGGAATLWGPVVAGVVIVYVPYYVSNVANGQAYGLIFGAILALAVFVLPNGVVGFGTSLRKRVVVLDDHDAAAGAQPRESAQLSEGVLPIRVLRRSHGITTQVGCARGAAHVGRAGRRLHQQRLDHQQRKQHGQQRRGHRRLRISGQHERL
jgi:branched-chain amino acid transport system permease protein